MQNSLLEAVSFAARAHEGQRRKDNKTPYASHPFRVCLIVRDVFGCADPRMLITALLHDTIEDTTTDFDDLAERFGPDIGAWVAVLTKDKRLAESERERVYVEGLKAAPWQVQVCKLADLYDNLTDLAKLPRDRQMHAFKRYEHYFSELCQTTAAEAKTPIALVRQLINQTKAAIGVWAP